MSWQTETQTTTINILSDISKSKVNQTTKCGGLIACEIVGFSEVMKKMWQRD